MRVGFVSPTEAIVAYLEITCGQRNLSQVGNALFGIRSGAVTLANTPLEGISIESPVTHMTKALISALGSLYRTIGIFRAPDFNPILQAFK